MDDISTQRLASTSVTVFVLVLWFFYKPQHLNAWALRIVAIACLLTTLVLWSNWRHKLFSIPPLFLAGAVAYLLAANYDRNSPLDWIIDLGPPILFLYFAVQSWKRAIGSKHISVDSGPVGTTPD